MRETTDSIPTFTIIISVTHSVDNLEWCLTSLNHLDYPNDRYHAVLVDCHVILGLRQFFTKLPRLEFQCSTLALPERSPLKPSWLHELREYEARNFAVKRFRGACYVFTEDAIFGAEIEMAKRIRDAGLRVKFLPNNPVWHRRVTTFRNFVRRNVYIASGKVQLMRQQHSFTHSFHFLVLFATIVAAMLGLLSLVSRVARILFVSLDGVYLLALVFTAIAFAVRSRSLAVGFGVVLLWPIHQLSIAFGSNQI